ncbi:Gfo/Idh/MocA family protein [Streptomyces sp. NPDC085946]|uniref:Gfo/Idh/MocA family protein n=1 Tax=Streptomyces sp. NPDC085946 TaxID=3365744 RepID=UPI0037D15B5F
MGLHVDALTGEHADVGEPVARLGPNPARIDHHDDRAGRALGGDGPAGLPRYAPADLERMTGEQAVDTVVVTSVYRTHAEPVDRSLRAGADVVVEKPLTTDAAGCRRITRPVADTGGDVVMTFDCRYAPRNATLRQVIADGVIGQVTGLRIAWVPDTVHGADCFRRRHRGKTDSGGLLVHKAGHHFDLVNWWIDDVPTRVYASGGPRFYGDADAARGMGPRPGRGTGAKGDPFSLDPRDDPRLEALYPRAERHDDYRRDQDPFAPGVTVEDDMSVLVDYARGATLAYSLNAHSPGGATGSASTARGAAPNSTWSSAGTPTPAGTPCRTPPRPRTPRARTGSAPPGTGSSCSSTSGARRKSSSRTASAATAGATPSSRTSSAAPCAWNRTRSAARPATSTASGPWPWASPPTSRR